METTLKRRMQQVGGTLAASPKKPDPVVDSQGGFFDPLSPVRDALTVPANGAGVSEDLSPENTKLRFEEVNEVTLKLTDGGGSNIPSSHGQWGGYRTARALAWVINIGLGHKSWLARCDNRSVGPTTNRKAKKAALAMVADPGIGKRLLDPIGNLNRLKACLLDASLENWEARST